VEERSWTCGRAKSEPALHRGALSPRTGVSDLQHQLGRVSLTAGSDLARPQVQLLNFFLCLAERLLLGLAGLLGALRLGRLARFERGGSLPVLA
jgi:hypothetical protein